VYADGARHGALRRLILAALCIREDALGRRLRMRRGLLRAEEAARRLMSPVGARGDVHRSFPSPQCLLYATPTFLDHYVEGTDDTFRMIFFFFK
jgi:hypothetical protein